MAGSPGPGEYIPRRRIEEGNPVLFYSDGYFGPQERGRVVSVDHETEHQLASILIYSDERTEADVPFAWGDYQPERGYIFEDQPPLGEL